MNGSSILRCCTASPPLAALRCCYHHHSIEFHCSNQLSFVKRHCFGYGKVTIRRRYPSQNLVDIFVQEFNNIKRTSRVRALNKLELKSSEEIGGIKLQNQVLQRGLLLEFRKDADRVVLAVAQESDGRKKWIVSDQNGDIVSIKRQQITFIVPGVGNFDHEEISNFVKKAQQKLDPSLIEFAWCELREKNESVTVEEFAEMIFGCVEPLESYCAHLLLSTDDIYFIAVEAKGSAYVYEPRPMVQVEELMQRKRAKEAAESELAEFVNSLKSAKDMPLCAKPPKSTWVLNERTRKKIESLQAYAIDDCWDEDEKRTVRTILKAMGISITASAAVDLLTNIGYFPVHVNLDLIKSNIRTEYPQKILEAAACLLSEPPDLDKVHRKDLTNLKVYAIDVDDADELDDALSATRLQDGRIKVWIHVADATSLVQPGSVIDREAMKRGTSVFLPTATYPMFPEKLAMEGMSMQQGKKCKAVTVSVVLHSDGSIAEYSVENSIIKPTYMLTYESAAELLHLNLEEEVELRLLSEAASRRLQWRRGQGAVDTPTIETRIKVSNPDDPEPSIKLYVENQAEPAMRLVTELMILCGEVIATFGSFNKLALPYRGQPQSTVDTSVFSHLPEGPIRSSAIVKIMRAAQMDFRKPIRHGGLGLPGYVQFTSPIRRYMDLLAHYQVKAFLRGDPPPFSAGQLERMGSMVTTNVKVVRKLSNSSLLYWIIEYMRRQPQTKLFSALVLRFIKDRTAAILVTEVGLQASGRVSLGVQVGDEIKVEVEEAHPRNDVITFKEVRGIS